MGYQQVGTRRPTIVTATALVSKTVTIDTAVLSALNMSATDFQSFQASLSGRIVAPGMPDYNVDRVSNPVFQEYPKIIVYCANINDVRLCLAAAAKYNWWVTSRSGGHSTAGYSVNSGIVIDTSLFSYTSVDVSNMLVVAGAGTRFQNFNATLDLFGVHVPGGGCSDVAIAGYMQGGGYGFTSRTYGMHCDNVVEVTLMTWDGRLVVANDNVNPDLFWAIRGGTGNQFGVLLEVKYKCYQWNSGWGFALLWETQYAAQVLAEMQRHYMSGSPHDKVGFMAGIGNYNGQTMAMMFGIYSGARADGMQEIASLLAIGNPTFKVDMESKTYSALDAGVMGFLLGPGTPGTLEVKRSQYIAQPVPDDGWQEIVNFISNNQPNPFNIGFIEAYGGAIERFAANGNAFIHRNVSMQFDVDSFWNPDWEYNASTTREQAEIYLDSLTAIIRKNWNGEEYQNYPHRGDPDFRWEYWADAFASLLFVKRKYDPRNFFRYEQSITPYPDEPGIRRSTAPSLFSDPVIRYID